MKLLKRTLVLLLCLAMLLPFSLAANAENVPTPDDSTTETTPASVYTSDDMGQTANRLPQEDTVIADDNAALVKPEGAEVMSLREENVKHFDMGNGTYQAIAYSHPVHEQDSDGNWQDIDFGMKLTQTRGVSTYTNTAGTTFAANYVANRPIMSMSGEDTSIDMTFIYAKEGVAARAGMVTTAVAEVTQAETAMETYADAQNANFSNRLFYENVMPGVDLEYIVDPWNVKENIIVKEKAGNYVYVFKLNLNGLYPVLHTDGSVFLLNEQTDEREYVIPAPYMYDAYGEMSFDVDYTVSGSNGTYYLSVTADSTWINAADRIFPITIDPTIYLGTQSINMDTYINEDTPNEARGSYRFFFVGENEVAYLYTPTPELPEGAAIDSAILELYFFYKDHVTTGYTDFEAYRVTDLTWAQESLTWNNVVYSGYENKYGIEGSPQTNPANTRVYANAGATSASPKLVSVGITSALDAWVNGTTNNGIALKYVESPNYSVMFRSTEGPAQYRPKLVYNYAITHTYEVSLILQYDEAYISYHGPTTLDRIRGQAQKIADFYMRNFRITVHYNFTPTLVISYADQCDSKPDKICACPNYSCHNDDELANNHHTNIYAIVTALQIPNPGAVRMAYIGRNICFEEYCTNPDGNTTEYYGLAHQDNNTMVIANHDGVDSETVTAIHEMGHMFGVEDHYAVETGYSDIDDCLYGYNGFNGDNPDKIKLCPACRETIATNRGKFSD